MIRRKLTLAAAVVTVSALSLTACSGGGNEPAADLTSVSIMAPFLEAQPPSADGPWRPIVPEWLYDVSPGGLDFADTHHAVA